MGRITCCFPVVVPLNPTWATDERVTHNDCLVWIHRRLLICAQHLQYSSCVCVGTKRTVGLERVTALPELEFGPETHKPPSRKRLGPDLPSFHLTNQSLLLCSVNFVPRAMSQNRYGGRPGDRGGSFDYRLSACCISQLAASTTLRKSLAKQVLSLSLLACFVSSRRGVLLCQSRSRLHADGRTTRPCRPQGLPERASLPTGSAGVRRRWARAGVYTAPPPAPRDPYRRARSPGCDARAVRSAPGTAHHAPAGMMPDCPRPPPSRDSRHFHKCSTI